MERFSHPLVKAVFSALIFLSSLASFANDSADYFARFKYSESEAIELLKKSNGLPMDQATEARNLLDDLGYWKTVRQEKTFTLTAELEKQIRAQYQYLEKAYKYEVGDLVWVKAENADQKAYGVGGVNHRAQIIDHAQVGGTDYYTVDIYVDGSSQMQQRQGTLYTGNKGTILYYGPNYHLSKQTRIMTKSELDSLNSPASSLPSDNMGEVLDWEKDKVWRDKLEAFKQKMVQNNVEVDFTANPATIEKQQQEVMLQIFRHFKMNRNAPSNNGKGIGMRACGGGVCYDQALVLTYAIQALGQSVGIKAYNLNGTTVNPMGGHGFVRYDLKTNPQIVNFDRVFPYELWESEFNRRKQAKANGDTIEIDFDLPKDKALYDGVNVRTSTWTGISDPGWADYGITADFFARVPVAKALNPLPVDSNRAVNGLSSQRNLSDVAEKIGAKGPLNTYVPQKSTQVDTTTKALLEKKLQDGEKLKYALEDILGGPMSCERIFN